MSRVRPALCPEKIYETCTFECEVLTPVHIGGCEGVLTRMDFLVDAGAVHVVDEDRLAAWLHEHGLIDSFVEEVGSDRFALKTFVQRHKKKGWHQELEHWTRYIVKGGNEGLQEFRPMIRDAQGRVFLPGSAIKGAIRTAVLWKRLQDADLVSARQVEDRVKRSIVKDQDTQRWKLLELGDRQTPRPVRKEYFSHWLQRTLLGRDPHHDLLRCLTVRDAYPVDDTVTTKVVPVHVICKQRNGAITPSSQHVTVWIEAAMPGSRFRVEMLWDRRQRSRPEWSPGPPDGHAPMDLAGVVACMAAHERRVIREEHEFFRDARGGLPRAPEAAHQVAAWYAEATSVPLFRLGFGGGMPTTTVNGLFDDAVRQLVRDATGHERNGDPAPKSRRIWIAPNGRAYPLGWTRVVPVAGEAVSPLAAQAGTSRAAGAELSPAASRREPAAVHWSRATCIWDAARCIVEVESRGNKAVSPRLATEEERRRWLAALPDELRRRLIEKRKPVVVDAEIEIEGNQKVVKAIQPPASEANGPV